MNLFRVKPLSMEVVGVLNFPVKVTAFLLRCSTVCERALGIHIPHHYPLLPPASTLNSHHVIKSVVFTLLRLDKKDRYSMKKKEFQPAGGKKGNKMPRSAPVYSCLLPPTSRISHGALGPLTNSAACLCRLPRSRERLSCVISLLCYTWRTLPLALSNTHTYTCRCSGE